MHIEGYLFIPYGGQFRFAFDLYDGHISDFKKSSQEHDCFWGGTAIRQRFTLHELVDDDCTHTKEMYGPTICKTFWKIKDKLVASPNAIFQKAFYLTNENIPTINRACDVTFVCTVA